MTLFWISLQTVDTQIHFKIHLKKKIDEGQSSAPRKLKLIIT